MRNLKDIKDKRLKMEKESLPTPSDYKKLQVRLKALIKDHGIDKVSAATGWTIKTLKQYVGVTVAMPMSADKISNAEAILKSE